MKKKLLGLIFAATMLFGASLTVFAAPDASGNDVRSLSGNDVIGQGSALTMESEVVRPVLAVTITAGTKVVANPYGLENAALGLDADTTLKGSTIKFENASNTAISVGLIGKIELAGYDKNVASADKVTVASSESSIKSTKNKQVFVQAAITNGGTGKLLTSAGKEEKALVYSASGAKMTNAPVLAADGVTADGVSDTMLLTLTGATSKSATSEWTEADEFKVITTYDLQFGDTAKLSKFGTPTS